MIVSRGDVVLVDWPFSDGTGTKVRPAVVVQDDDENRQIADTIIALISSRLHRNSRTHVFIDISTADGQLSGLRRNSVVQCGNLYTADQGFILRRLGQLTDSLVRQVDTGLRAALHL